MIKLFEEFFKEYKSIYEKNPRNYRKESKFEELVLKTRNNADKY